MIDEKILLSEISDLKKNTKSENGDYLSGYFSALSTIEGMIAGYPKVGTLFPCEERLPEEMQDVLIKYKFIVEGGTHDGEERIGYGIGYLCKKKWTFSAVANNRIYNENIIAWTPLQEAEK